VKAPCLIAVAALAFLVVSTGVASGLPPAGGGRSGYRIVIAKSAPPSEQHAAASDRDPDDEQPLPARYAVARHTRLSGVMDNSAPKQVFRVHQGYRQPGMGRSWLETGCGVRPPAPQRAGSSHDMRKARRNRSCDRRMVPQRWLTGSPG